MTTDPEMQPALTPLMYQRERERATLDFRSVLEKERTSRLQKRTAPWANITQRPKLLNMRVRDIDPTRSGLFEGGDPWKVS